MKYGLIYYHPRDIAQRIVHSHLTLQHSYFSNFSLAIQPSCYGNNNRELPVKALQIVINQRPGIARSN